MKDIHGGDIWSAALEKGLTPDRVIDFSASINPLGLPEGAARAIKEGLALVSPYPDPASRALKEAIEARYGVAADTILPGNGSTELIYLIPQAMRPRKALIVEPAFSEYRNSLLLNGCKTFGMTLWERDGFGLDIKRLKKALEKGLDLLYICNPANPTGKMIGKDDMLAVIEAAKKHSTTVVIDEAFADFCPEASIVREAPKYPNAIVLRSLTKFYSMAGLRLGFMAAGTKMINRISRFVPPWSVNTLASSAGVESLKDTEYREATLKWLEEERGFLMDGLSIEGLFPYQSSANYIMCRITATVITATVLRAALSKRGILIRDLSAFRGLGERYIRVAVKSRRDNIKLISCLNEALSATAYPRARKGLLARELKA